MLLEPYVATGTAYDCVEGKGLSEAR